VPNHILDFFWISVSDRSGSRVLDGVYLVRLSYDELDNVFGQYNPNGFIRTLTSKVYEAAKRPKPVDEFEDLCRTAKCGSCDPNILRYGSYILVAAYKEEIDGGIAIPTGVARPIVVEDELHVLPNMDDVLKSLEERC